RRSRDTKSDRYWSSDVCSSDLGEERREDRSDRPDDDRDAVLVGVSGVVRPITAIFTPLFVTSFHGVAQSGRAVPAAFVMFAERNGYFASLMRARSVSTDQSNS